MMTMTTNIHGVTGIKIRRYIVDPDSSNPFPVIEVTFTTPDGEYAISALDCDVPLEMI